MSRKGDSKYWFPAKRFGYGWDLPVCWQGWAIFVGYMVLVTGGIFVFKPDQQMAAYLIYTGILSMALIAICWWKGEKPKWRWGERSATSPKKDPKGLLLFHLFMGPLLLGFGLYVRTHLPAEINGSYGHRTHISMQSQEVWDEAQRFSANAMIAAALITIIYQAISCITMRASLSLASSVGVLMISLFANIGITEFHLSRHFDEHGRRRAGRKLLLSH